MKRHRRKTRPATKKRRSATRLKRKQIVPTTPDEFYAMSKQAQDQSIRVTAAVTKIRSGIPIRRAAAEFGLTGQELVRLAGTALKKGPNGVYTAKPVDRLPRVLSFLTNGGMREIAVRDSREATKLAKYWSAVHRSAATGDASRLKRFRGKYVTDARGVRHALLTDIVAINRLANAGVLSFESLYPKTA